MNEKKPLIIASAALGLIILVGGGVLYYLHFVVLPKAQKALDAAQKAVADAKDKQGKIKGFTEEIERLKKEEEKKKTRIPNLDSKEYDGLANLLDDLRKRAGVELAGGTFSQSKTGTAASSRVARTPKGAAAAPTAGVHKVQYDLNVKGGLHQLLRFLNLLEKERRFLNVETFDIAKGAGDAIAARDAKAGKSSPGAPIRNLKVVVSSYTYRVTTPAPSTPTPAVAVETDKGGQSTPVPD